MPATVIVGLQWGDEGKGKATDFLAEQVRWVVRYQGGDNAGHTIVLGDEVFKLHLVPSGVLYPHIVPLIGPGVVVNPATLIRELDGLAARGIDASRVRVSHAAHVILPYHVAQDRASEARLGREGIGTTNRGIGPAYADRAARVGVRMEDLLDAAALRHKLERVVPDANARLAHLGDPGEPFLVEAILEDGPGLGRAPPPEHRRHDQPRPGRPARRRARPLRGRPGHPARPGPRVLPVRDLVQPGRRRRLHRRRHRPPPGLRGDRGHEGLHDPRGRRSLPDRAARRDRRGDRDAGPRVRDDDRPAPSGRLVRCRAAALRGRREQRQQHRPQQARHPVGSRRGPALRRLRGRRSPRRALAGLGRGGRDGRRRSTSASRAGRRRSTRRGRPTTCRRTRAPTSAPSRRWPGCRSGSSRSAPSGPRRS